MANRLLDPDGSAPAAKHSVLQADEPRYLLDELAARKLSALLAGETSLDGSLAARHRRRGLVARRTWGNPGRQGECLFKG